MACESLRGTFLEKEAGVLKHIFIINPTAGKKRSARALVDRIQALDLPYEIAFTEQAGDARRIAREVAESGEPARLYACGGDGTLNEVVNGAAGFDSAAVTNVPIGTGNDFLKIFGKGNRARFSDLKALSEGPQAAMDLIDCNGRLGIDIVCTGLDARVAVDKDKYNNFPLVSGIGAYAISAVANVLFKRISQPVVVDMENYHFEGEATIICVCSGRYYGGGFMPVGDNMPDDGLLETLVVRKVDRLTFFRLVGEYGRGRYARYPNLIRYGQGKGVTVRSSQELVAVVDGEPLRARELTIKLSDKRVNFFYPAGLDYLPKT